MARHRHAIALAMLCAATSATMAPGVFAYDSLLQWYEGRTGRFGSNQPPMLGILWRELDRLGSGASLLVTASCCCFCIGSYLVIRAVARPGRALLGVAALALYPPLFVQLATINKETVGTNLLLLGFGLAVGQAPRPLRWPSLLGAAALVATASMVRYQLLIAAVPLFLALLLRPRAPAESWLQAARSRAAPALRATACCGALLAGLVAWIDTTASVDWRGPVEQNIRLQMIYEMAAIAAADPGAGMGLVDGLGVDAPPVWAMMAGQYTARSNITLAGIPDLLRPVPTAVLALQRAGLAADHDGVVAGHRLATFGNLLGLGAVCWPVQKQIIAPLPGTPEMLWATTVNLAGLAPSPATSILGSRWLPVNNPMFRPVFYLAAAACLLGWLLAARHRRRRFQALVGLPVAALLYAATFLPVTPSCDFRYLYPSVLFTCLAFAALLLAPRRRPA